MKTIYKNHMILQCRNMALIQKKLLKIILAVILITSAGNANATNYYFSSSGNDAASGTSPATAWQTIAKFNSYFSSLSPGDSVLFNRGDVFYGAMTISRSGTSALPIIIGAYGSGAKPIVTALATVSSWTNSGGNIWISNNAVSTLARVNMVVINAVNTPMGRWPNTGYRTISSHVGNTSITDNSLPANPNWTGAEVVIRRDRWTIDRSNITSHSGNTINYSATGYDAINGFGYFVQSSVSTLDAQNEWYYNPSTKKIQVYSSSAPSNVQVSNFADLVTMSGRSYIKFTDVAFQGANNNGFQISNGNNITIQNCDIDFSGNNGINASSQFLAVQNSTINHSNNNAIYAGSTNNITISNNIISNAGFIAGAGGNQADCYIGILAIGSNVLIEYNQLINSGYNAIEFNGSNTTIKNNFLNTFCALKDDGGGIYSWNDGGNPPTYTNRFIQDNIIINGVGATAGTNSNEALAEGIYLDDNAANVTITRNSITNCGDGGIFIHNAHEVNITYNTIYNCLKQLLIVQDNIPSNPSPLANLYINNNICFARTTSQSIIEVANKTNSGVNFGTYDYNYYTRPINESSSITACQNGSCSSFPWNTYNLVGWIPFSTQDAHSKTAPVTITNVNDLRFEYNQTGANKTITLGANYIDVKNKFYPGTITLAPYSSAVLIKTNLILPIHDVALTGRTDNNKHVLSWRIIADEPIKTIVIESSSDATNFGTLTSVNPSADKYTYQPFTTGTVFYRLKVTSVLDQTVFSNIVALKSTGIDKDVFNVSTLVQSEITVNATSNYQYVINDINGRIIAKGNGIKGLNRIDISNQPNGMYFLQLMSIDTNTGSAGNRETQKIVKH